MNTVEYDMIFAATENYFKCKQMHYPNLPKPLDWLAEDKYYNEKWRLKKAELIACDNYDPKCPLATYCELMFKWTQVHKIEIT